MCHLAHRIVRAFLAAKGVIIFQHQCAEVGQLDFHIRMQMPEIESAAAYILAVQQNEIACKLPFVNSAALCSERVTATRTCAPLKMSTILGRLNVLRLMLF